MTGSMSSAPIDVDDLATWPAGLADAVRAGGRGAMQVAALIEGRTFRAYHCSRLLPHEVARIRREGLRPSALSLVREKLDAAVEAGVLEPGCAARLLERSVLQSDVRAGDRIGQVWLCVGLGHFAGTAGGVKMPLSTWGGESVYWHAEAADRDVLRGIGAPSIVVVDVPLSGGSVSTFPPISDLLRAVLGLSIAPSVGDAMLRAAVDASAIVDIWQPGAPEYDRFGGLPGTVGAE